MALTGEQYVSVEGFFSCCRLCASNHDPKYMTNLFDSSATSYQLPTMITDALRLEVKDGDGLPRAICNTCILKLNNVQEFVKNSAAVDQMFRKLLAQVIELPEKDCPEVSVEIELLEEAAEEEVEEKDEIVEEVEDTVNLDCNNGLHKDLGLVVEENLAVNQPPCLGEMSKSESPELFEVPGPLKPIMTPGQPKPPECLRLLLLRKLPEPPKPTYLPRSLNPSPQKIQLPRISVPQIPPQLPRLSLINKLPGPSKLTYRPRSQTTPRLTVPPGQPVPPKIPGLTSFPRLPGHPKLTFLFRSPAPPRNSVTTGPTTPLVLPKLIFVPRKPESPSNSEPPISPTPPCQEETAIAGEKVLAVPDVDCEKETKRGHVNFIDPHTGVTTRMALQCRNLRGDRLHVTLGHPETCPMPDPPVVPPKPRVPKGPKTCVTCGKSYRCFALLNEHIRSHTGERPFACDKCGKSFSRRYHLNVHIKHHTGALSDRLACKVCGKVSLNRGNLKIHMLVHSSARPHVCPVCHKAYKQRAHLKYHGCTSLKGFKPFACPGCGKCFKTQRSMEKHELTHSVPPPPPSQLASAQCATCGKSFTGRQSMLRHEETHKPHTLPPQFKCDLCDKVFVREIYAKTHRRRVHGKKTKESLCSRCGLAFKTVAYLNKHELKCKV